MNIDINSDLGEAFGPYTIADDEALMGVITSANVACGYHAGDPVVMDRTIRLAKEHGVDLGAMSDIPIAWASAAGTCRWIWQSLKSTYFISSARLKVWPVRRGIASRI